ncbi:DUF3823 domain-containing protein [Ferruginibacter albus]|uniref:DUF3823 domain-containing protein n=1 Tax=Ferruginibacter albus TaxID=2875540 RepID=UPI001CC3EFD0|nr:DUF3823 domain-containing protein [Ferruginibacter albus]UAY50844.1 DUF3823 domain-containing protein [Ferruginibacter albus]
MKLKFSSILAVVAISIIGLSSCVKEDNYLGPDASLSGTMFVDGSNNADTIQTCTSNFSIRLEQLSWSSTPTPQDIPIKADGTYQNTELFSGHYRVSILGGAFWPVESKEIDVTKGSKLDFQLIPYLFLNNASAHFDDTTLVVDFHLEAPIDGIPKPLEMQVYTSATQFVGPGASIDVLSSGTKDDPRKYIVPLSKEWADFTDGDKNCEIKIPFPTPLKERSFFIRAGIKFNDSYRSSNLSNIMQVTYQ